MWANAAASQWGAACIKNCDILFNTPIIFQDNSAGSSPAVYCDGDSSLRFEENLYKALANNNDEDGEDLYIGI